MRRGGWSLEALALIEQANRAGAGAGGAGGAAPAVGGVTHPPQSARAVDLLEQAAPPSDPPAASADELALEEAEARPALARLHRVGLVWAVDAAELEGLSPDAPTREVIRPAAVRWGVPVGLPGDVPCVARGIDTLHLAVYTQLAPDVVDALAELHRLARKGGEERPVFLAAGGLVWRVTWTRPPYTLALDSAGAHLRVARAIGPQAPQVYAEIRAGLLWRDGPGDAADRIVRMLRGLEVPRSAPTRVEVSRIDLAVDLAAPLFTGAELVEGRWVTRAVHRALYAQAERMHEEWEKGRPSADHARGVAAKVEERRQRQADRSDALYWRGRTFTGGAFGAGDVRVRYYRKDVELDAAGGKAWFRDLWRAAGWNGVAPVWRVEVQLRGPALASMVGTSSTTTAHGRGRGSEVWRPGAVTCGKSWTTVLRTLDGLWRYAVGSPEGQGHGWVTLRDPTDAAQPTWWPVSQVLARRPGRELGQVAGTYGAETVEVVRLGRSPARPTRSAGRPGLVARLRDHDDGGAQAIAQAIDSPAILDEWGDGPSTEQGSDAPGHRRPPGRGPGLRRAGRVHPRRHARRKLQVFGTLAAWVSSMEIARKLDPDPQRAAVEAGALVVRLAEADRDGWETACGGPASALRSRGRSCTAVEIAQKCGVKRRAA
ncbi:MAG: hypothetical protein R3F60_14795 [bacterium]